MSICTNHDLLHLFLANHDDVGYERSAAETCFMHFMPCGFLRPLRIILTHTFVKTSLPELPRIFVGKLRWMSWLSAVVSSTIFLSKTCPDVLPGVASNKCVGQTLRNKLHKQQILLQFREDRSKSANLWKHRSTRGSLGGYGGLSATAEEAKSSWIFWGLKLFWQKYCNLLLELHLRAG